MNLNLALPDPAGEIAAHREILTRKLFDGQEGRARLISDWPVLVPDPDAETPLPVFQVWWPSSGQDWNWIDPDGALITVEFLPTTDDYEAGA